MTQKKLHRLAEEKVDVLVHMCPNCHIQFDRYSDIISASTGEEFPFMHLHVQQLLALALGADPEKVVGVQSHSQDVEPFLERIGARSRRDGRRCAMRAGVFLCECGGNISGVVDLEPLAEHARSLDGVVEVERQPVHVRHRGPRDDREGRGRARPRPLRHRLVLAALPGSRPSSASPASSSWARTPWPSATSARAARYVHAHEPERAQVKARKIVEGAVARLQHMSDLPRRRTFLNRSVLVVGGGIAGISAAEELAAAGIEVHLVERQQSIGGYMSRLSKTFPTEDCAMCRLAPRLTGAATNSRIHIHSLSDVTVGHRPARRVQRHRPAPAALRRTRSASAAASAPPCAR